MIRQRTLKNVIRATGIGLHTGEKIHLTLRPAPVDTGVVFLRSDLPDAPPIPARAAHVGATDLATTLVAGAARISTVEHLLAAFAGVGIDNVYVDVSAAEVPIMDGSAAPFVFLVESAGIAEQDAPRRFLRVRRRIEWSDGDARVSLAPHDGLRLSYELSYAHPVMARHAHRASVDLARSAFSKELARARTFGFLKDFEQLRARDLARGCNLDNVIAVGDERILNDGGLRYEDEFARHKLLDALGDLYLLGAPLIGAFEGYKSGHAANNALLSRLLAEPDAFEMVTFDRVTAARSAEAPRSERAALVD